MADSPIPEPNSTASPIQADNQGTLILKGNRQDPVLVVTQDPIVSIVNTNGVTTVTVLEQHWLKVGHTATIAGTVNTNFSGAFKVSAIPTPFSFQFLQNPPDSPWPTPSNRLRGPFSSDVAPVPPTPFVQGARVFETYGYFVLPYVNIKPSDQQSYAGFNQRSTIEGLLSQKRMYAEKVSLINGSTAYRIPKQYLWLLKFTRLGPYIGNQPSVYQIVPQDPTASLQMTGPWVPVGA